MTIFLRSNVDVVTRPLPSDGAMMEDHGAPGNREGPGSQVMERQIVSKERGSQRVSSWTL